MCMLILKPKGLGTKFRADYLKNSFHANPDGVGIAYSTGKHVHITKGITFDSLLNIVKNLQQSENYKDMAIIVHFRAATSGIISGGTCHPFPLSSTDSELMATELDTDMAMAHNGIITQFSHFGSYRYSNLYGIDDEIEYELDRREILSDTMLFVKNILSDPAIRSNLGSPAVHKLISDFVGSDKIAVIDKGGNSYIWGHFQQEDGILYSNTGYKYRYIVRGPYYEHGKWHNGSKVRETQYYCSFCGNTKKSWRNLTGEKCDSCNIGEYVPLDLHRSIWVCPECYAVFDERQKDDLCPHCGTQLEVEWYVQGDSSDNSSGSSSKPVSQGD